LPEECSPIVIKIAETHVDRQGVREMLAHYGALDWLAGKESSGQAGNDAEFLTEIAGRSCYKSFGVGLNPNVTTIREDSKDYLNNVLEKGDGSIFEHATVTFAFLNASRVLTHELVRHRVGVAISQESMRYVRPTSIKMWVPPELADKRGAFLKVVEHIEEDYQQLQNEFDWNAMSFELKKRVTSALRRILPSGIATTIIWTANHRTLRWVIERRTDPSAEIEIRLVFDKVAEICIRDYPNIYGDFTKTQLTDGTWQYAPKYSKV
jgi:thymidylate synthase (FAD)